MRLASLLLLGALAGACSSTHQDSTSGPDAAAVERVRAALAAADRIDWDKPFDASRKPLEYITFFDVRSGMQVLDLGAAAGYTSEVLAAAVGPQGLVYAQIDDLVIRLQKGFFDRTLKARIGPDGSRRANIVYWHHELDDLQLTDLDLVHWGFNLHDHYHMQGEAYVQRVLAGVHDALKVGGTLAVSDHVGVAGRNNRKLHRIEPATLIEQLEKAGFRVQAQSDLLANPNDDHSLNVFADEIYRATDRILVRAIKDNDS